MIPFCIGYYRRRQSSSFATGTEEVSAESKIKLHISVCFPISLAGRGKVKMRYTGEEERGKGYYVIAPAHTLAITHPWSEIAAGWRDPSY